MTLAQSTNKGTSDDAQVIFNVQLKLCLQLRSPGILPASGLLDRTFQQSAQQVASGMVAVWPPCRAQLECHLSYNCCPRYIVL
jgi:hypothetical protein